MYSTTVTLTSRNTPQLAQDNGTTANDDGGIYSQPPAATLSGVAVLADGSIFCAGRTNGTSLTSLIWRWRLTAISCAVGGVVADATNTPHDKARPSLPQSYLGCSRLLLGDWDGPNAGGEGTFDVAAFILSSNGQDILWKYQVMRATS